MRRVKQLGPGLLCAACMLLLILDAKTATNASRSAVELCLYTVVPNLFPFIMISIMLTGTITGFRFRVLQPISKLLGIPQGAQSILLMGFLGGYPVGAQSISDSYHAGRLDHSAAVRMLGFCNNAGPAFIFGMISGLFSDPRIPWVIWSIHVFSGCLVGILIPKTRSVSFINKTQTPINASTVLEKSLKTTGVICGWVIIFRIIIDFAHKWVFATLPPNAALMLEGVLELANGCTAASQIEPEGLRFVYICAILGFGGLCVLSQTKSMTKGLGLGLYFPGKVLHCVFSITLSIWIQPLIFPKCEQFPLNNIAVYFLLLILLITCIWVLKKKTVAFFANNQYNRKKYSIKGV